MRTVKTKVKMALIGFFLLATTTTAFAWRGGGCYTCWWFQNSPRCLYDSGQNTMCFIITVGGEAHCGTRYAVCNDGRI